MEESGEKNKRSLFFQSLKEKSKIFLFPTLALKHLFYISEAYIEK
jgi:hypothetical protein